MSLREEIAALMCERYCGIGVMALPEYLPADVEIADELVNKILDAAVSAIYEEYPDYHEDAYICIKAINKLREGK
jgi:hypothetical protein